MTDRMNDPKVVNEFIQSLCADYRIHTSLTEEARTNSNIKRGLRNDDGTGVMIGCTKVGNVLGYTVVDGERVPMDGRLIYRGYDLDDLVRAYCQEGRFGFPEVAYLLLFGSLPSEEQLGLFTNLLHVMTDLPANFTEDMILKNPSHDIMNKLGRSVLALYSTDPTPDELSVQNMMRQSIELVARFPVIVAYAYVVKRHYFEDDSLYLHRPEPGLSIAENFLRMIRPDKQFTHEEARLLDLCLVCTERPSLFIMCGGRLAEGAEARRREPRRAQSVRGDQGQCARLDGRRGGAGICAPHPPRRGRRPHRSGLRHGARSLYSV